MKYSLRHALTLIVFFILNGCAVGNKHTYHDVILDIEGSGSETLAVSTIDLRVYVKNGDKTPDFVGLQRGGFGNPFDVTTASGKSLAEDINNTLETSLNKQGFNVIPVIASNTDTITNVITKMTGSGANRMLLLILNEWKSDTYNNTALIYNVTLRVMNDAGNKLVEKSIAGRDDLGGDLINPPSHAKKAVPAAFKQKLEALINDEKVLAALM